MSRQWCREAERRILIMKWGRQFSALHVFSFLICCCCSRAPLHSIFTLYLLCPAHHHPPHVAGCVQSRVCTHWQLFHALKWISDTKIVPLPWLPSTTWRPSGWTGRWSRWSSTGARSCWWRTQPPCEAPPSETLRRWMNFAKRYDEMIDDDSIQVCRTFNDDIDIEPFQFSDKLAVLAFPTNQVGNVGI